MSNRKIGWALLSALVFAAGSSRATFIPGTDDVPAMDDFQTVEADDFAFDTPSGQILTYEAKTAYSPVQIRTFYQSSLTAMGWQEVGDDQYARGEDILQISFPEQERVRLDITLSGAVE